MPVYRKDHLRLLRFVFVALAVILIGGLGISAQKPAFQKSLEDQLSCVGNLEPAKAIKALQTRSIISKERYLVFDSWNYFRTRKPLKVWGLQASAVFGFEMYSDFFARGPGTAPPNTIGVVVKSSPEKVKSSLPQDIISKMYIERSAFDQHGEVTDSSELTEISCRE